MDLIENILANEPETVEVSRKGFGAWSYSKATLLRKCPLQFYLKYITKTKTPLAPISLVTEVGKAAHKILELLVEGKPLDKAFALTKKEYVSKITPEQWTSEVETLEMSMMSFSERFKAFSKKNKVKRILQEIRIGVTDTFEPTGFFSEDVFYRGVIDLCFQLENNDLISIDHKTGAPALMGLKPFRSQLDTYKVLFHYGVDKISGAQSGIHYIRDGEIKLGDYSPKEEIEGKLLGELNSSLDVTLDFIKDVGSFKHIAGNHCKYCDFKEPCKNKQLKNIETKTVRFFK